MRRTPMTPEDAPVGHLLSRRQVITLLGATGALWLMGGRLFSRPSFAGIPAPPVWSDQSKPKAPISSMNA